MNEKDIAEIRRRFKPEKCNITHVCGCYVNDKKEIVSQFDQPFLDLPQDETEKLLATLKRTLSGTVGKNLIDIEFATQQVVNSEEHQLLTALRDTKLQDSAPPRTICCHFTVRESSPLHTQATRHRGSQLFLGFTLRSAPGTLTR